MNLDEKLDALKPLLDGLQDDLLWIAHPLTPSSLSTHRNMRRLNLEIDRHAEEIGRSVLSPYFDGEPAQVPGPMAIEIGVHLIRAYHRDLLRQQEHELDLWADRDWAALRREGYIDDDAYFEFVTELGGRTDGMPVGHHHDEVGP